MDKLIARQKSKRKRLLYNNTLEKVERDLKVTGVMPEKGRKWEQVSLDYRESDTTQNAAVWTRLVFFPCLFFKGKESKYI